MSKDILLQDDNDIYFDGSDIGISEGNQTIKQEVIIIFNTHTREWFYNLNFGIEYLGNILGEKVSPITIDSLLYNAALSIDGVLSFADSIFYDFDATTRILAPKFELNTIYGILPISIPGISI